MLNLQKLISFWLILLPNLALFYVSLWLTILWRYPAGLPTDELMQHILSFSIIYIFWLLAFLSHRLFERETFRRYTTLFFSLVSASVINLLLAIAYFYFQPELILTPRRFLLVHLGIAFALILVWDILVKIFIINRIIQPVYLFSLNKELDYLRKELDRHNYLGFHVAGDIDEQALKNLPARPGIAVIFPDNLHADPKLANAIFGLRNKGIKFYNHNTFYEKIFRRVYLPSLNQIWFLQNISYYRKIVYSLIKSVLDLLAGFLVFIIFLVIYPLIALGIKLDSRGRVFFTQQRVGENGKLFTIYKYRTMAADADPNKWTEPNDSRITRFGKFLRLTRLDELPQSMNLLKGDMSVVGPRPEQGRIVENLKQQIPFYEERHIIKPGITGWAQLNVYAGNLEETKIKLEYDLYYIKKQSILFDLEIVLKTVYNIIRFAGR